MRPTTSGFFLLISISPLLFSPAALAQIGGGQPGNDPFARVQFIHSLVDTGPLDVYLDGNRWLDDFAFRAATPSTPIYNGAHVIDLVAAEDTTNAAPLWTGILSVTSEHYYLLTALGKPDQAQLLLRQNVREKALSTNAEFFVIHAAPDTGPLDIRLRDPSKDNAVVTLVHNNIPFGSSGIYIHLFPDQYNFEVTTSDNRKVFDVFNFNLSDYGGRAFVFVASGGSTPDSLDFALIGYDNTGSPIFPVITTATEGAAETPTGFSLAQNYPNPFNPTTQIHYTLAEASSVRLAIFDLLGRTVQTLVEAEQPPGAYAVRWDGRNDAGTPMPSGVYLYRLTSGDAAETRQMLLVK